MPVTKNFITPQTKAKAKDMQKYLEIIEMHRLYDAIVTAVNAEYANRYTVDIYANGFSNAKTHEGFEAVAVNPGEEFAAGWPMKILFDNNLAYGIQGKCMYRLFVTEVSPEGKPHKVTGKIGNVESDSTTVDVALAIDWVFGWSQKNGFVFTSEDGKPDSGVTSIVGLMLPRPTLVTEPEAGNKWLAAGMALTGGTPPPIKWGTLTAAWTPTSQTVTLQPVADSSGTAFDPVPATISARIIMPIGAAPAYLLGEVGDVFAYEDLDGVYLLKSPQTTPIPAAQYEVIQAAAAGEWMTDYLQGSDIPD